jgi:hypothetical protein
VNGAFLTGTPFKGTSDAKGNFVVSVEGSDCELTYSVKANGKPISLAGANATNATANGTANATTRGTPGQRAAAAAAAAGAPGASPAPRRSSAAAAGASLVLVAAAAAAALVL